MSSGESSLELSEAIGDVVEEYLVDCQAEGITPDVREGASLAEYAVENTGGYPWYLFDPAGSSVMLLSVTEIAEDIIRESLLPEES